MISPSKWKSLSKRMDEFKIFENDLEEKFIRSSGKGGQNVNKVNTCVYLKHLPTAHEVKCQKTRSQQDNRYFARQILTDKIEAEFLGKKSKKEREIYKKKKQKQKRSKRAKSKILEEKKKQSVKKDLRKKPSLAD